MGPPPQTDTQNVRDYFQAIALFFDCSHRNPPQIGHDLVGDLACVQSPHGLHDVTCCIESIGNVMVKLTTTI